MEVSRISFTKKTRDEMKKDLSVREKGKVLFARLQELDDDGTLSKAKTRADVARLAGYSEERAKAGYAWVSNLIRRGHLTETIQGWTPSGKIIAEYHLANTKPDYAYEGASKRRTTKKVIARVAEESIERERVAVDKPIKVEITRGETTIRVELAEVEQATNLITTILKGE